MGGSACCIQQDRKDDSDMRGKKKNKNDNKDAKDLFADNAFKAQPTGKHNLAN